MSTEMNMLVLAFEPLFDPDPEYGEGLGGRIRLRIIAPTGVPMKDLIDLHWHIAPLMDWLYRNRTHLLTDELPINEPSCTSIAATLAKYYDELEPNSDEHDELIDQVYQYRTTHGLRFGLRGTEAPDVYFGLFHGRHEVSQCTEGERWSFAVNLQAFLDSLPG